MGLLVVILLALVVFWLVAHVSVLLAVVAALLVLALGFSGGRYYGARRGL
jgi:hypothetical protein